MSEYLYGPYGRIGDSVIKSGDVVETAVVYFGTAPINLVRGYEDADLVDTPIVVNSLTDGQRKIGWCGDFESFTLCEALAAHFEGNDPIGPAYFVNVLDPKSHKGDTGKSEVLSLVNGKTELPGTHTILDSVKVVRPLTDYPDIAYCYAKEDAEAVFKAKGKTKAPVSAGQVFYYISPENLDAETDYLMTVTCDGKVYGVRGKHEGRPEDTTVIYFSILNGSQTDFVDGVKKEGNDQGKLDLSTYTGDVEFAVYKADYAGDYEKYPNILETVDKTVLHFDEGACPQYYTEDTDYILNYNPARDVTVIEDADEVLPPTITVVYDTVDDTLVTAEDIVGRKTRNGEYSGIAAIDLVFDRLGVIPNILAAPGWSHIPEVGKALCKACRKVSGHWDAIAYLDMPIVDSELEPVDTMDKAKKWKVDNHYDDERSKVFWPMAVDTSGRIRHLSSLAAAAQMRVDMDHSGVPYETCANKPVDVRAQYFGAETSNRGFNQTDANELTKVGITTITPWGTDWVLWGDHTAAYDSENPDLDARCIFDVTMRMLMYITNSFQWEWADDIDRPMTRAMKDSIVNREQEKLDNLVGMGALLGEPTVEFSPDVTSTDILQGHFTWNFEVTPTVPLKSATAVVVYTDSGFAVLLEGE